MNKRKHLRHFLLIAALAIILVLAGCSSANSYVDLSHEYAVEAEEQAVRQLAQAALAAAEPAPALRPSDSALISFSATFPTGKIIVVDNPGDRADVVVTEQYRAVVSFVTRDSGASVSGDTGELELEHGLNNFSVIITAKDGTQTPFDFSITVVSAPPESDPEPEPEEPQPEEPQPEEPQPEKPEPEESQPEEPQPEEPKLKATDPTEPDVERPEPGETDPSGNDYEEFIQNIEAGTVRDEVGEKDAVFGVNEGTINTNKGKVADNNGIIKTNEGIVYDNKNNGEVESNSGWVMTSSGTVDKNETSGVVVSNEGTVKDNDGTVETNDGTVDINKGIVEENSGTVGENVGTVKDNYGTVENNTGTVENNYAGTVNGDGTVGQNWYYLEYDSDIDISEGEENVHSDWWYGDYLKEGGEVTFKKDGNKLTATREDDEGNEEILGSSDTGKLTIKVEGGDYTDTIKVKAEAIPPSSSEEDEGEDTPEPSNSTPTDAEG